MCAFQPHTQAVSAVDIVITNLLFTWISIAHSTEAKFFAGSLASSYAMDALGSQLGLSALCPHWHGVQSVCSPQECPLLHPVLPQGLPVPYLCVGGSVASLRYQVLRIVDGTFVY